MAIELQATAFETGLGENAGTAVITCQDADGKEYAVKLDTMSMQTMSSFLADAFSQVADQAGRRTQLSPSVDRIQLEIGTKWGTEILRVYVTPTVYHEYSTRSDTNLARHFRELARLIDQAQAERSSPATDSRH